MLSNGERKYLNRVIDQYKEYKTWLRVKDSGCKPFDYNDYSKGIYGHNARIMRARIRKKIKTMLSDLRLMEEARQSFLKNPRKKETVFPECFKKTIPDTFGLIEPVYEIKIHDKNSKDYEMDSDQTVTLVIPCYQDF